jgi:hypothetical protein
MTTETPRHRFRTVLASRIPPTGHKPIVRTSYAVCEHGQTFAACSFGLGKCSTADRLRQPVAYGCKAFQLFSILNG